MASTLADGTTRIEVTLELDDIQATVLRPRPAPYWGTYIMLHVYDPNVGRELIRRLTPYVASSADWWEQRAAWIALTFSYTGLKALGVPQASLDSFPEAFKQGMAARADHLRDFGENAPEHWDLPFGTGDIHLAVAVYSDTEEKWRHALTVAREQYQGLAGISVLALQDFGAQPDGRNSLGYKDGIGQPVVEGSGVEAMPGQGPAIVAGEFVLGYPGLTGLPPPAPSPGVLGRNGTFVGLRKYQTRVGAFNRFLHANGETEAERELLAAKMVGRWRSGAPLALAPDKDDPALGENWQRNDDFTYANDQAGRITPRGCHMRRMNPRDTEMAQLTDVSLHRIIRRGTAFGRPYDPNALSEADDEGAGVYFLFLGAHVMSTIEFLQSEWINDGNFMAIGHERDPILGLQEPGDIFTIPRDPVRKRLQGIETFNVMKGGEYLFMPSLSALKWLGTLDG